MYTTGVFEVKLFFKNEAVPGYTSAQNWPLVTSTASLLHHMRQHDNFSVIVKESSLPFLISAIRRLIEGTQQEYYLMSMEIQYSGTTSITSWREWGDNEPVVIGQKDLPIKVYTGFTLPPSPINFYIRDFKKHFYGYEVYKTPRLITLTLSRGYRSEDLYTSPLLHAMFLVLKHGKKKEYIDEMAVRIMCDKENWTSPGMEQIITCAFIRTLGQSCGTVNAGIVNQRPHGIYEAIIDNEFSTGRQGLFSGAVSEMGYQLAKLARRFPMIVNEIFTEPYATRSRTYVKVFDAYDTLRIIALYMLEHLSEEDPNFLLENHMEYIGGDLWEGFTQYLEDTYKKENENALLSN